MAVKDLYLYTLQQADNCLITGQRLSEWCGHGPVLEQDIAMTNIALDLIGQARMLYQYAAELNGKEESEDEVAFLRDGWDYRNALLVELPNGDWAQTILKQFLFDSYSHYFYEALVNSSDERLAAIAAKSVKETQYHLKWSGDWVIRLGDGTEESHSRIQHALAGTWSYAWELTQPVEVEVIAREKGYGVDLNMLNVARNEEIQRVFSEAGLKIPETTYHHTGGKEGKHTEYLGYILAEMQFLQRAYPRNEW